MGENYPKKTKDIANEFKLFASGLASLMTIYNFNIQLINAKYAVLEGLKWDNIDYNYNLFLSMYMKQIPLPANDYDAKLNLTNIPLIWKRKDENKRWKQINGLWKPKKIE